MDILIVEDDSETARFLAKALHESGHRAVISEDGAEGLYLALTEAFDVLVVDRMLPRLDGLALLDTFRKAGKTAPVLILSALADVDDRVAGLRAGGDDYLGKPFALTELLARVEALGRRPAAVATHALLKVGDLSINPMARTARRADRVLRLQPREYQILEYLAHHAGQVVTRMMLLSAVWGYDFDPQTNVIDVHVSRLRQKVDRDFPTALIATVRGAGYRLGVPE